MKTLMENGMIEKWRKEYYPRNKCNRHGDGPMTDPATIKDTQGAFLILSIGIFLGAVVLLLEGIRTIYLKHRRKQKRLQPRHTDIIEDLVPSSIWD
jgi:hypothetical protein